MALSRRRGNQSPGTLRLPPDQSEPTTSRSILATFRVIRNNLRHTGGVSQNSLRFWNGLTSFFGTPVNSCLCSRAACIKWNPLEMKYVGWPNTKTESHKDEPGFSKISILGRIQLELGHLPDKIISGHVFSVIAKDRRFRWIVLPKVLNFLI